MKKAKSRAENFREVSQNSRSGDREMNPEQYEQFITLQTEILLSNKKLLEAVLSIQRNLEILIGDGDVLDPQYKRSLADYRNFDWSSIEAKIIDRDKIGVSKVEYKNRIYRRTLPENKFVEAIIFSRDEAGERQTLITFRTFESAQPVSRKVVRLLSIKRQNLTGFDREKFNERTS